MSALYSCLKGKNDTIMAAKPVEGTQTIENEETPGDCSGKKKSKFQAFKKLFVKKKRKESPVPSRDSSNLKPSQSSSDVSVSGANESAFQPAAESVSKSGMGSKAVSHDSVFISEMESSTKEDTSHENIPGKVKALQLQLQQNLRIGSPPQGIIHKKLEDSGALSEDDGLPRSPPEITSLHEILALSSSKTPGIAQRRNSLSLGGTDSEDEPEPREISSCPISPLNSSILLSSSPPGSRNLVDFSAPPSSVVCLDNSAAKHKIAVKPKKRRGPAMNTNRTKDGTGIKHSHKKEIEKPEMMVNISEVVCEREVSIPHSGESSAEQEASNNQTKIMEDTAQETEIDTSVSLIAQEDDSSGKNTKTCENAFIGKQMAAPLTDISDCDLDFHISLKVDDPVIQNEKHPKPESDSKEVSHSCQSAQMHEPNDLTADMEPYECENTASESVHLEVSEDIECDTFEDLQKVQEVTSVSESDDPIINNQDQEHEEYAKVLPNLSELQNDLPEVNVSTSDTNVLSAPQKHILETYLETSLVVDDEPVCPITSECAVICQSTDHKSDDKIVAEEKLQEPSANTTNKQPRITDTPSTDKKLETFGLKIIESPMDLSIDDGGIKCIAAGSINSGSEANGKDILCTKEFSTEMSKTIKPIEVNVDSKLRTSNKPVRFTVAPAWQRSLSVGSSVKDAACSKNKVSSSMKSDSFDGSDHPVMDINQEEYRKSEKDNEMAKTSKDLCGAFGVRLRRTSSSRKYEEYPEEQTKLHLSPVETVPIVTTQNIQTPTRTPQPHSDFVKLSKPSHTGEDKPQKKQRAEDLSSQENSEPAWITVAKLKQKGFQVHPLAREHSVSTESDKSEGSDESCQKKSAAACLQEPEVKRTESTSTESQVEENLPESGKSTQSATNQNPDEPPWFSLAKKKAKAWSKMPQIVQ